MSTVVERARNLLAFAPDGFDPTQEEAQQFVLDALLIGEKCARIVGALDGAIEGLRREHVAVESDEGGAIGCPANWSAGPCDCGADAHNARLDGLRKMLDEVAT